VTAFAWFGAFVAILLSAAALMAAASMMMASMQSTKEELYRQKLECRIRTMVLWCSYEFPIVEQIANHILGVGEISPFRDELRRERDGKV
jgi:hypothetical protein